MGGDGGRRTAAPFRHLLCRQSGVAAGNDPDAGKPPQKAGALADGLLVGVDFGNLLLLYPRQGQQLVADTKAGGAHHAQVVLLEELIYRPHRAVGAVFDGQHPKLAEAGFHRGGHRLKALDIDDTPPGEQPVAGHLGVGPLHPLAGHHPRLWEQLAASGKGGLYPRAHLGGCVNQLRLAGTGQLKKGGIEVIGVLLLIPGPLGDFG